MENKIKFNDEIYLGFKKELDEKYNKELEKFKKELDEKYERELEELKEKLNRKSEEEFREFEKKLEQLEDNFASAEYNANKFQYDLNNLYKSILKCENTENINKIISEVILTISNYVKNDQDVMREIACKTLARIAMNINKPDVANHIIKEIGNHVNLHLVLFEIVFNSTNKKLQSKAIDELIEKDSTHNVFCVSNNIVIKNNNITEIINNIYNLGIKNGVNCKNLYREFLINIINNSKDKKLINLLVQKVYEFDSNNEIISDVFRYYDDKIYNLKDDIALNIKALICDNTKAYFSNIFKREVGLFKASIDHLKVAHAYIKHVNKKIKSYKNYRLKFKKFVKIIDNQQCKKGNCNIFKKIISNVKIKNKFLIKLFNKRIKLNDISEIKSENEVDFIKTIIEFSNDNKKIGLAVEELIKINKFNNTQYYEDCSGVFADVFDFIKNDEKKTKLVLEKIRHNNIELYNSIVDDYYITDNNKYIKQIANNFAKKKISLFRR